MAPALSVASPVPTTKSASEGKPAGAKSAVASCVLHKTPITPPLAVGAQGIYFDLADGRRIIDAVGGAAVACIGSGHPVVVEAIREQAGKLSYTFHQQLTNEPVELLAKTIIDDSEGAFALVGFVAGGTEAMEGALKTARQYFYETGQTQRTKFIGRKVSYHGASLGTLGAAFNAARRAPYEPILDHETFHHVSPAYYKRFHQPGETEEQYVERLKNELEAKFLELGPDKVIAFVAETVVGASSGVVIPPKGYFKAVKSVCDKYGALLVLDEVMSGMGRVGSMHAWQTFGDGVSPDIQAVAKGLGAGYTPMGAVLISRKVADGLHSKTGIWQHGYTYQAHPLCCAASLAVQKVLKEENLIANIRKQGALLGNLLKSGLTGSGSVVAPYVFDIRGSGGFWAVEFEVAPAGAPKLDFGGKKFGPLVEARCFEKGVMIMGMSGGGSLDGTVGDHCMFAPAYNVKADEVQRIVEVFIQSVEELVQEALKA